MPLPLPDPREQLVDVRRRLSEEFRIRFESRLPVDVDDQLFYKVLSIQLLEAEKAKLLGQLAIQNLRLERVPKAWWRQRRRVALQRDIVKMRLENVQNDTSALEERVRISNRDIQAAWRADDAAHLSFRRLPKISDLRIEYLNIAQECLKTDTLQWFDVQIAKTIKRIGRLQGRGPWRNLLPTKPNLKAPGREQDLLKELVHRQGEAGEALGDMAHFAERMRRFAAEVIEFQAAPDIADLLEEERLLSSLIDAEFSKGGGATRQLQSFDQPEGPPNQTGLPGIDGIGLAPDAL